MQSWWYLLPWLLQCACGSQSILANMNDQPGEAAWPDFAFSEHWHVLGPFQIGTREAVWGADPLEQYGGFRNLQYSTHETFASSLPPNATVSWSNTTAKLGEPRTTYASAELRVGFDNVDWSFLQQIYGWAALQWQAWARGEIIVQTESAVTLAFGAIAVLEYYIDGEHYFGGDRYGFSRAPAVIRMSPGKHTIDVRLIRDVRSMGGVGAPTLDFTLELTLSREDLKQGSPVLIADKFGDGTSPLASSYGSVTVRNNAEEPIFIGNVEPPNWWRDTCETRLVAPSPIKLMPGQSRPVGFQVACVPIPRGRTQVDVQIDYRLGSTDTAQKQKVYVTGFPRVVDKHEPHKITYLHPGGIVSYAILRPPSKKAIDQCGTAAKLPILLALHGAGLEADSEEMRHVLDPVPDLCAWTLFPSGVTSWSGDDWHTWGFADVEAAVAAIPKWIEHNDWTGPGVDIARWLVVGHSNGGQGAWYALTHRPDKVFAAAVLSGYSSIQNYVPYQFWHTADSGRTAVVQSAMSSYRHELLLSNARGLPIYQQHGSADDNVPVYHARLMHQILGQADVESQYIEMEGKPHYWDGVVTTEPLVDFYERHLPRQISSEDALRSPSFSITTANPADTGAKGGMQILLLHTPGQVGRVQAKRDLGTDKCSFETSNVQMLRLPPRISECASVEIDGQEVIPLAQPTGAPAITGKDSTGRWTADFAKPTRSGRQLGPLDSILRTNGTFHIVTHSQDQTLDNLAVQTCRNLCQYFYADAEIGDYTTAVDASGNIISLAVGTSLSRSDVEVEHPIRLHADHLEIRDSFGRWRSYNDKGNGLAAAFLRPLPDERLELVVWGVDTQSLAVAARLVPMLTGSGVPDFVVADRSMLWKGTEAALVMGFFDGWWNVSTNSFFS